MKECLVCKSQFEPKSNSQKYCSIECGYRVKNDKRNKFTREELENAEIRKCLICDKEINISAMQMTKIYCSEECRRKAERVFGDKRQTDLDYKNQIRFGGNKYKVMERDNYECQMCGNKHKLIVHHIDDSGQGDDVNNDMGNLVTLCRSCHINLHRIIGSTGL